MTTKKLKIGIDYHGVIDQHPEYFALFCKEAISRGHKIYVITGGPSKDVAVKLGEFNNPYNEIFAIVDFYGQSSLMNFSDDGKYKISDELWNKAKGEYCRKEKIDIHIDDSQEYIKWFTTPYCLYNKKENKCKMPKRGFIDFSYLPAKAVDMIEQII